MASKQDRADKKAERQEEIKNILEEYDVSNQNQLVEILSERGYETTQSSISRDFHDLAVVKVRGKLRVFPPEYL